MSPSLIAANSPNNHKRIMTVQVNKLLGAPGLATSNKKLLGVGSIEWRSKAANSAFFEGVCVTSPHLRPILRRTHLFGTPRTRRRGRDAPLLAQHDDLRRRGIQATRLDVKQSGALHHCSKIPWKKQNKKDYASIDPELGTIPRPVDMRHKKNI